jgi:hypothetical protein
MRLSQSRQMFGAGFASGFDRIRMSMRIVSNTFRTPMCHKSAGLKSYGASVNGCVWRYPLFFLAPLLPPSADRFRQLHAVYRKDASRKTTMPAEKAGIV